MGAYGFCLSCYGFFGGKFFSLSFTVFGGRIDDLCKSCLVRGDFSLLGGVIHAWVIDSMCVFAWTTSLDFSLFVTCYWICACWNSAECSFFFRCSWKHSVPTGSVSLPPFYICCLDWLEPPSMKQRCKSFLSCRTLQYSLLPGGSHSSCALLVIFYFLFYRHHKILSKPDGLVSNSDIYFLLSNLPPCGLGHFHRTLHMSVILCKLPCGVQLYVII